MIGLAAVALAGVAAAQTPPTAPAEEAVPAVTPPATAPGPTTGPAPVRPGQVKTIPGRPRSGSPGTLPAGQATLPATRPVLAARPPGGPAAHSDANQPAERPAVHEPAAAAHGAGRLDYWSMVFVFMLATFIGIGVIRRVSRLLHTPLMSLTNAISAIAVVGAIIVAGGENYPTGIRILGAVALFCSMTNIISGFLITDRMLKMFKTREGGKA